MTNDDTSIQSLLEASRASPHDLGRRARAARALEAAGRGAEAVSYVLEGSKNLTAHEEGPLPCLCRRCLDPERSQVELEGGLYYREFSQGAGRVLFYWVPSELKRTPALSRSVALRMEARLQQIALEGRRPIRSHYRS